MKGKWVSPDDIGGTLACAWAGCAETCTKAPDGTMPPGWHMVLSTGRTRLISPGGRAAVVVPLDDLRLDVQLCPTHVRALWGCLNPALPAPA